MEGLFDIVLGSVLLSIIHALIPNHWLPIVAIGRNEGWHTREKLYITAITGTAHTLSTVIIGIAIGYLGFKLSSQWELVKNMIAPGVLFLLGIYYLFRSWRVKQHHHHHFGEDILDVPKGMEAKKKNKFNIIASLAAAMFFSPCLELTLFYFRAGSYGAMGISMVTLIYLIIPVFVMMLLVGLAEKGIEKIKWDFLEHHEKIITGAILIALGFISFFVENLHFELWM